MSQSETVEASGLDMILDWGSPSAQVVEIPRQERRLLRVEEAAHQLGIERTLMYELLGSGAVESVRIGRLRRIPVECLDEFVANLRALSQTGVT